jgi:sugar phosphate isomerase/epimerase
MTTTSSYKPFNFSILMAFIILTSCSSMQKPKEDNELIFARENLIAWCIVPFDALNRNAEQRAEMLNELGITKMAWDWRMEHIESLPVEIETLSKHNIELAAVWFWIDRDLEEGFLPHQEQIFKTLAETGTQTTIWACFSDNFFDNLNDPEKIERAVKNLTILNNKALETGCKVALYNHMNWFGEPENQVNILEKMNSDNIGIVYNLHHGHHHIERFAELLQIMMPHLWIINLNGMNEAGPKILTLGEGEHDASMIKIIRESGFKGTIGIIGHTEGEDIQKVLERNLEGMKKILSELSYDKAYKTFK